MQVAYPALNEQRNLAIYMVGATGVEPARIAPKDPKSFASANSATRPSKISGWQKIPKQSSDKNRPARDAIVPRQHLFYRQKNRGQKNGTCPASSLRFFIFLSNIFLSLFPALEPSAAWSGRRVRED